MVPCRDSSPVESRSAAEQERHQRAEDEATERFSRLQSEALRQAVYRRREHNDAQVLNQRTHTAAHLRYKWKPLDRKKQRETRAMTNAARRRLLRRLGFGSRLDEARHVRFDPLFSRSHAGVSSEDSEEQGSRDAHSRRSHAASESGEFGTASSDATLSDVQTSGSEDNVATPVHSAVRYEAASSERSWDTTNLSSAPNHVPRKRLNKAGHPVHEEVSVSFSPSSRQERRNLPEPFSPVRTPLGAVILPEKLVLSDKEQENSSSEDDNLRLLKEKSLRAQCFPVVRSARAAEPVTPDLCSPKLASSPTTIQSRPDSHSSDDENLCLLREKALYTRVLSSRSKPQFPDAPNEVKPTPALPHHEYPANSSLVLPTRKRASTSTGELHSKRPKKEFDWCAERNSSNDSEDSSLDSSLLQSGRIRLYFGGKELSALEPERDKERRPPPPVLSYESGHQATVSDSHLLDIWETPPVAIPVPLVERLYTHQRQGIAYLYDAYRAGQGAILADDMGLGKTAQVIGFLLAIMHRSGWARDDLRRRTRLLEVAGTIEEFHTLVRDWPVALLIVPTTLIDNWTQEMDQWGYMEVAVAKDKKSVPEAVDRAINGRIDVLVLNLELVRDSVQLLNSAPWAVVVLDEAHRMISGKSSLAQALLQLDTPVRVALTGTPFLNGYEDLWQLFHWVNPNVFTSLKAWKIEVSDVLLQGAEANAHPIQKATSQLVARRLRDYLFPSARFLRRTKKLLSDVLPPKKDRVVLCPLSEDQKRMYKRVWSEPELQAIIHGDELCCGKTRLNARGQREYLRRRHCCDQAYFLSVTDESSRDDDEDFAPPAMQVRQEMVEMGENPSLLEAKNCRLGMALHPMAYQTTFLDIANHLSLSFPSTTPKQPPPKSDKGAQKGSRSRSLQSRDLLYQSRDLERQIELRRIAERHERQQSYLQTLYPNDWSRRLKLKGSELADQEYCGKWPILQSFMEQWYSEPPWTWARPRAPDEVGNKSSSKGLLRPRPNKVLIFSHRPKVLDMIGSWLSEKGRKWLLLDGSTQAKERQGLVDAFNDQDDIFVFLISTMAGGVGLNLTSANKVVIFDPDWKPAIDEQAMDRAHRPGQTRPVEVFRLIAQGTIEERMYERQMSKTIHSGQILESDGLVLPLGLFTGQAEAGKQGELYGWRNLLDWNEDSRIGRILEQIVEVSTAKGLQVIHSDWSHDSLPLHLPEGYTVINNFLESARAPLSPNDKLPDKLLDRTSNEEDEFEGDETSAKEQEKASLLEKMLDQKSPAELCSPQEMARWTPNEQERELEKDVSTYTEYLKAFPQANPPEPGQKRLRQTRARRGRSSPASSRQRHVGSALLPSSRQPSSRQRPPTASTSRRMTASASDPTAPSASAARVQTSAAKPIRPSSARSRRF